MAHQIYQYAKTRQNFGRQIRFCETMPQLLDSVYPDELLQKQYCLRNRVHCGIQASSSVAEHDANTKQIEYATTGVNHAEGGWPKDVPFNDEEATTRLCRRVERSDEYVDVVLSLGPKLEHLIHQNNVSNLYDHYFKGMPEIEQFQKPVVSRIIGYKGLLDEVKMRPVASIDWTFENDPKIVAAYCDKKYPANLTPVNTDLNCCVWDLSESSHPVNQFSPPTACWQILCSPISPVTVFGGLEDGRVCMFDIRDGHAPVAITETHLSHTEPVTSLAYLESRYNNEFFSGSTDGKCLWYDIRNMSKPIDSLLMAVLLPPGEVASIANVEPISVLSFQKIFPTIFLCGTDTGLIVNVNRKGKSHNEVMSAVFEAHLGPVRALHRNPSISKMLISCGDWTTHIWSNDIQISPIITGTSQRHQIQDVVWAPHRVSSYMTVGNDGKFRYWDILRKMREPIIVMAMSNRPLVKIKPQPNGRIVAMGDNEGNLYVIALSDSLVLSGERDKQIMTQIYDRETRREHILETRIKEIRVKIQADKETLLEAPKDDFETDYAMIEVNYRQEVLDELKKM